MSKRIAFVIFGLFILVLIVSGRQGANGSRLYGTSVMRLKKLNVGLIQYVSDYDDCFPTRPEWMDALDPYVPDQINYHSPAVSMPGYGYALNADLLGGNMSQVAHPDTTLTVFDSTDLSRNAVESTSTLPNPPRYGGNNTLGFADGHVKDEPGGVPPTPYELSRTRLKQAILGTLMYASDYDDYAPLANRWMDEVYPYTRTDSVFRSPLVEQQGSRNAYGYALNSAVAGQYLPSLLSPSTTMTLFDSTVTTRNATAMTKTLPQPPRYGANNTIAFADGHVP